LWYICQFIPDSSPRNVIHIEYFPLIRLNRIFFGMRNNKLAKLFPMFVKCRPDGIVGRILRIGSFQPIVKESTVLNLNHAVLRPVTNLQSHVNLGRELDKCRLLPHSRRFKPFEYLLHSWCVNDVWPVRTKLRPIRAELSCPEIPKRVELDGENGFNHRWILVLHRDTTSVWNLVPAGPFSLRKHSSREYLQSESSCPFSNTIVRQG